MTSTVTLQLEQARRRTGVSLEQIANATKISTRFLRAIESEEFEKLPGGVFDTNYIRQYARAIEFSERQLLEYYGARQAERVAREVGRQQEIAARAQGWSLRSCVNWLLGNPSPDPATEP